MNNQPPPSPQQPKQFVPPLLPSGINDPVSQESWAVQTLVKVAQILEMPYIPLSNLEDHAQRIMTEYKALKAMHGQGAATKT